MTCKTLAFLGLYLYGGWLMVIAVASGYGIKVTLLQLLTFGILR